MHDHSQPGRPERRRKTDEKIESAVIELLRDHGPDEITIDRVCEVSGVAKTTLYRRYRDREEMLEAIADSINPPLIDTVLAATRRVSYQAFLEALLELQRTINGRIGQRALSHLFLSTDDFMLAWRERLVQPQLEAAQHFFDRGVDEGVFDPTVDFSQIIEFALGSVLVRTVGSEDLSDDWARSTAQLLWPLMVGGHGR